MGLLNYLKFCITLLATNIAPENGCLEYDRFLYFQGRTVSFRYCIFLTKKQMSPIAIARCYFLQFLFSQNQQAAKQQAGTSCFLCEPPKRKNKGNILACPLLKALSKMFFLFPRWNMLVPWSVYTCVCINIPKLSSRTFWSAWVWPHDSLFACLKTPARHRLEAPKMPPGSWGSLEKNSSSWWFQPIWNILVKLDHFLK